MKKQVSPTFAVIVILVAVGLGAMYFMMRYRAHTAAWNAEAAALRMQADQARRTGRGMYGDPSKTTPMGMREAGARGGAPGGRAQGRPGARPGGASKGETRAPIGPKAR